MSGHEGGEVVWVRPGDRAHGTLSVSSELVPRLEAHARELGFTLFGVALPDPSRQTDFYEGWLERDFHGEMAYLARNDSVARRADLRRTMSGVASVLVLGHEYYHEDDAVESADPARAIIARYARGEDYHEVVVRKLTRLLEWLAESTDGGVSGRVYVDTGPILERDLARKAGLGWFGKNTLLIDPRRGSYFVLGLLLLDHELPPSGVFTEDRCGTCTACLDACPTGALLGRDDDGAPLIDARRCISYLTIELKGAIPHELRPLMGNRVFGCDICQEVCPWNQSFAMPTAEAAYTPRKDIEGRSLVALTERLLAMSGKAYQREFASSPLARPRRKGMLRNLCVGLGNWLAVDPTAADEVVPTLVKALNDGQALVRRHAAWALGRGEEPPSAPGDGGTLGASCTARSALLARLAIERTNEVCDEIDRALDRSLRRRG
jgi:epoxyqueuosine reductase